MKPAKPNFGAFHRVNDHGRLAERIVGALERNWAAAHAAGGASLRNELQALVRGVVDEAAEAHPPDGTRDVTVLVSDIRGFTGVAEAHPLPKVVEILNRHLAAMCEIIYRRGGTVDKFMGDSIMALFGVPVERPDSVENAIACAIEMQRGMEKVNRENERLGLPALYQGIGINTGEVMAGRIGSALHSEYTVIGDEVNVASRIEACSLRGQILISGSSLARVDPGLCTVSAPILLSVKGKRNPLRLFEVLSLGPPWDLRAPERDVRRSPRASVDLPFRFQLCEGKVVVDSLHEGRIGNLSVGGMQASTWAEVEPHLNLRFRLSEHTFGLDSGDIYGRVLKVRREDVGWTIHVEFVSIAPEDRRAIGRLVRRRGTGESPSRPGGPTLRTRPPRVRGEACAVGVPPIE